MYLPLTYIDSAGPATGTIVCARQAYRLGSIRSGRNVNLRERPTRARRMFNSSRSLPSEPEADLGELGFLRGLGAPRCSSGYDKILESCFPEILHFEQVHRSIPPIES